MKIVALDTERTTSGGATAPRDEAGDGERFEDSLIQALDASAAPESEEAVAESSGAEETAYEDVRGEEVSAESNGDEEAPTGEEVQGGNLAPTVAEAEVATERSREVAAAVSAAMAPFARDP